MPATILLAIVNFQVFLSEGIFGIPGIGLYNILNKVLALFSSSYRSNNAVNKILA